MASNAASYRGRRSIEIAIGIIALTAFSTWPIIYIELIEPLAPMGLVPAVAFVVGGIFYMVLALFVACFMFFKPAKLE
jgi:hypothetical protein